MRGKGRNGKERDGKGKDGKIRERRGMEEEEARKVTGEGKGEEGKKGTMGQSLYL